MLTRKTILLLPALCLVIVLVGVGVVYAARQRPIEVGQTEGFGKDRLLVFDYDDPAEQPFECAGIGGLHAAPCKVGVPPGPTSEGEEPEDTPDLFILVPFFDADGDDVEVTGDGGDVPGVPPGTLLGLFGVAPDGWDPDISIDVQCPEPAAIGGAYGFCFNHPHSLDLGPLLESADPVELVLPNHTHVVEDTPGGSKPWDNIVVLVLDESIWPEKDGDCPAGAGCLTSVEAIRDGQAAGLVSGDILSDLYLFFGVHNLEP